MRERGRSPPRRVGAAGQPHLRRRTHYIHPPYRYSHAHTSPPPTHNTSPYLCSSERGCGGGEWEQLGQSRPSSQNSFQTWPSPLFIWPPGRGSGGGRGGGGGREAGPGTGGAGAVAPAARGARMNWLCALSAVPGPARWAQSDCFVRCGRAAGRRKAAECSWARMRAKTWSVCGNVGRADDAQGADMWHTFTCGSLRHTSGLAQCTVLSGSSWWGRQSGAQAAWVVRQSCQTITGIGLRHMHVPFFPLACD